MVIKLGDLNIAGASKRRRRRGKKTVTDVVKRQINRMAETKQHDVYQASLDTVTPGNVLALASVTQGQTDTTRIGDILTLNRLTIRYTLFQDTSGSQSVVRIIVFKWRPDDAVDPPATTDILYNASASYNSNYVRDMSKFKVLYDRRHTLGPQDVFDDTKLGFVDVKGSKKLGKIKFAAASATGCGNIYMLYVSSNGSAATAPNLQVHSRVTFKDF